MNAYISFETAILILEMAYLASVMILLVASYAAIAVIEALEAPVSKTFDLLRY